MQNVLIVDDSESILNSLREKLLGYPNIHIFYAKNYQEAINILRKHNKEIDVALLDVILPDAPNGEVIALANLNNIPSIVLTATLNKKTRETIQKKEIISYILKNKSSSIDLAVKTILMALSNSQKTVLVVDDSDVARKELSHILEKINLKVIKAENGEEALEILQNNKEPISLLITDYDMPVLDGLEFTIKARELYDKNNLGIIVASAHGNKETVDNLLTFGANDFIHKPLSAIEVIAKVNINLELLTLFENIEDMANKDYLTGLYNRRYLFETGNNIFLKSKREKASLAVAMIDIDKFKDINDVHGHDIGDLAIKEMKKILEQNLRTYDLSARFGGEEFCIILENITLEDTQKLFEKIRQAFEDNVLNVDEKSIKYTVSIGIAFGLSDTFEDMIRLSDKALYESKETGRNKVTIRST